MENHDGRSPVPPMSDLLRVPMSEEQQKSFRRKNALIKYKKALESDLEDDMRLLANMVNHENDLENKVDELQNEVKETKNKNKKDIKKLKDKIVKTDEELTEVKGKLVTAQSEIVCAENGSIRKSTGTSLFSAKYAPRQNYDTL